MNYLLIIGSTIIALYLYYKSMFLDHITYSGNMLIGHKTLKHLLLRTIQVVPIDDLLPSNIFFRLQLFWAIYRCTEDDMFIRMGQKSMNVLQPAILNGIAAVKGAETLCHLAQERETQPLYFAVTFEKFGDMKSRKIRVIVLTAETLEYFLDEDFNVDVIHFRENYHKDRVRTLVRMAKLWKEERDLDPDIVRIVQTIHVPL